MHIYSIQLEMPSCDLNTLTLPWRCDLLSIMYGDSNSSSSSQHHRITKWWYKTPGDHRVSPPPHVGKKHVELLASRDQSWTTVNPTHHITPTQYTEFQGLSDLASLRSSTGPPPFQGFLSICPHSPFS